MSEPTCVICASRNPPRTRHLDHGHVCPPCATGLRHDLTELVTAAATAAVIPDPYATTDTSHGRGKAGSRPPLDLAHIDPPLILVRADPDDPSSAEPLLVLLESWCRVIREDRGLVPYGVATEDRAVTLAGTVAFLTAHLDWCLEQPDFRIAQLAGQVRRALAALRALDERTDRDTTWTIPCPADRPQEAR